jgi:hypothetical protein
MGAAVSVRGRPEQRDANEGSIIEALEADGWVVERVSSADFPDLVCLRRGEVRPLEVKSEGDARMRPGQVELHRRWERSGHPIPVVTSIEEACEVLAGKRPARTYRDFPWRGVNAVDKARRLRMKP